MGREEGEGFRMGNMRIPVADSCWYMAKPIQYCKVKNEKKEKKKKDSLYYTQIKINKNKFKKKHPKHIMKK